MPLIISTPEDIKKTTKKLIRQCPYMKKIYQDVGYPPTRRFENGFPGLARIVIGQQLSVASASAIWTRFENLLHDVSVRAMDKQSDIDIKSCGVSSAKIKTLRALCEHITSSQINFEDFVKQNVEDTKKQLTNIHGIGPWTADLYLMFCLGHPDAWASGDLALQYAVQNILSLQERPTAKELEILSNQWQPWRGVAARLLWSYYSHIKQQKSALPL